MKKSPVWKQLLICLLIVLAIGGAEVGAATLINLATQVRGILAVANGGTGAASFTSNCILKGGNPLACSTATDAGSGLQIGSPTGGAEGAGTLNATGLFVNGVAATTTLGVIAPQTDASDTWAANNSVCVATAKCPFVTHVTFPGAATSGTLDGKHTAVTVHWLFNATGSNSPAFTWSLRACAAANYTAGADATTLPTCSSGEVILWITSSAALNSAQTPSGVVFDIFAAVGGTAGTFSVSRIGTGGVIGNTNTGTTGVVVCGTTCSGGTWVIYPTIQYAVATAGNQVTTTGFLVESAY